MKIITHSYRTLVTGLFAFALALTFTPQSQATVPAPLSMNSERVAPVYGGGGKDGQETHGRSIAPTNNSETHD